MPSFLPHLPVLGILAVNPFTASIAPLWVLDILGDLVFKRSRPILAVVASISLFAATLPRWRSG